MNVFSLPTWKRYFYKEFILTCAAILFIILGLYIVIDLMAHLHKFSRHLDIPLIAQYYIASFFKRFDTILPFTILLATIRCLCLFQSRGELIAMFVSGIPRKTLLRPFFNVTLAITCFLYINYQAVYPWASQKLAVIEESEFGKEEASKHGLKEIHLTDASKLIYKSFSRSSKEFQDVFWIKNADELYHMKSLNIAQDVPCGTRVDQIRRTAKGLEKVASWPQHAFHELNFQDDCVKSGVLSLQEQPIIHLSSILYHAPKKSLQCAKIQAALYYKLASPLLCILAYIAVVPFCLRFSRTQSILTLYLIAISSLFCFNVLVQAFYILAKNQLATPLLAIGIPWTGACFYFGKKYAEL
jgi:lipopolysaccharide export system permease protein